VNDRRIPALDGLRAVAVIAVIVCHVNWAFGGPFTVGRVNGPVAAALGVTWVGVDLFFVLSGFLITGILCEAKGGEGFFRNFYARRSLRILPLYYGFLLFAIFAMARLPATQPVYLGREDATSLALYYYNFRVVLTDRTLSYFHPFWSLAIEEHFYLAWPVVVWLLRPRSLMWLCAGLMLSSLVLRGLVLLSDAPPMMAFFWTPFRLDSLLAGSFVALAWRDEAVRPALLTYAQPLALSSGVLLLAITLWQGHFIPNAPGAGALLTVGLTALAVFFAGVLVLAVNARDASRLKRILENDSLRAIGYYSYAIYVFHALILHLTVVFVPSLREWEPFLVKPLIVLWTLGVSFVAAWLSYQLYEKHFLRLKRFFEYSHPGRPEVILSPQTESCLNA
jgi:peptidoglycan/LPS O-acetylase OafA/YrhL